MDMTWLGPISSLISIVKAGIDAVKAIRGDLRIVARDLTIREIKGSMDSGSLNIGDRITAIGTFSPYLPFVDLRKLVAINLPSSVIHCACRLDSIKNSDRFFVQLSSLFGQK